MWAVVWNVGSVVGLATGAFTLWDRFARARPIASLVFRQEGERRFAVLYISNPGEYAILIRSIRVSPDVYFLSEHLADTGEMIREQVRGVAPFQIGPRSNAERRIASRYADGGALSAADQKVTFSVSWRRGSFTWLWQPRVKVRTETATIRGFERN
jgi:hypothetical protein